VSRFISAGGGGLGLFYLENRREWERGEALEKVRVVARGKKKRTVVQHWGGGVSGY